MTILTEGMELARSLDESLAKMLKTELLLDSARDDVAIPDSLTATIADLGIHGVAVAESEGGLDLDLADRVRLSAVLGRRLVPAKIRDEAFGTAPALAGADTPDTSEMLGRLLDGDLSSAVGLVNRTNGEIFAVVPANTEVIVILGKDRTEIVRAAAEGVDVTCLEGLDPGQGLSRVHLNDAEPITSYSGDRAVSVRREFELALICEAFGSADMTLELSAAYADEREQFGRPISSFQAVGHLLAEMKLGLETSRAGIGRYVDLDSEEGASAAELEQWRATLAHSVPAAARRACEGAIQVHGGIGFSWELGLHLHYRRILADQYLLGGDSATAELIGSAYIDRRMNS